MAEFRLTTRTSMRTESWTRLMSRAREATRLFDQMLAGLTLNAGSNAAFRTGRHQRNDPDWFSGPARQRQFQTVPGEWQCRPVCEPAEYLRDCHGKAGGLLANGGLPLKFHHRKSAICAVHHGCKSWQFDLPLHECAGDQAAFPRIHESVRIYRSRSLEKAVVMEQLNIGIRGTST